MIGGRRISGARHQIVYFRNISHNDFRAIFSHDTIILLNDISSLIRPACFPKRVSSCGVAAQRTSKQTPAFNVRQMGWYDKADPAGPQQASSAPPFASSTTRFGGFLFGDDFINTIQNPSQRRNDGWPMSRVFHATVFPRHAYFASHYACRGPSGWGSPLYRVTGGPQRSSCLGPFVCRERRASQHQRERQA